MRLSRDGDLVKMRCPHNAMGRVETYSGDTNTNDLGTARVGDIVTCLKCGKKSKIISGSSSVFINDKPAARLQDLTHGPCDLRKKCCRHSTTGSIRVGSGNTDSGG